MNETIETLKSRRSIRKFKSTQIKDSELTAILEAGTYAPTGMNRQSPIIVAIQDKAVIKLLAEINAGVVHSSWDPFYGAPTVIVVLADKNADTYLEDGSLVMGNLMNAAYSLGIGSCWIHRAKETFETVVGRSFLQEWGIDENYVGIGNCILGYPGEEPTAKPRKEGYIKIIK